MSTLPAGGWVFLNDSSPPGSTGWFQGDPAVFAAASGAADSYVAANFNNAGFGGAVSNWLVTPELALFNGESLNFSLRLLGEGLLDRVEVYLSTSGASTSLADFALLAGYQSSTDTGWQGRSALVNGLAAPASGRFAFRYTVDDTSLNGNYVGIDAVSVNPTAIPEPVTVALVGLGVIALAGSRRRLPSAPHLTHPPHLLRVPHLPRLARLRLPRLLLMASLAGLALTAQAGPNGVMRFPHVQLATQPAERPTQTGHEHGGFMAYKDPVTGQLTSPNPEQAALLTSAGRVVAPIVRQPPPTVVRPPHGGISVLLDESHDRYLMVRKAADGTVRETCEPGLPASTGEQQ